MHRVVVLQVHHRGLESGRDLRVGEQHRFEKILPGLTPAHTCEIRAHVATLRRAIVTSGGTEVTNLGDGLMVVSPARPRHVPGTSAARPRRCRARWPRTQPVERESTTASRPQGLRTLIRAPCRPVRRRGEPGTSVPRRPGTRTRRRPIGGPGVGWMASRTRRLYRTRGREPDRLRRPPGTPPRQRHQLMPGHWSPVPSGVPGVVLAESLRWRRPSGGPHRIRSALTRDPRPRSTVTGHPNGARSLPPGSLDTAIPNSQ